MKTLTTTLTALGLGVAIMIVLAPPAQTQVAGSAHDLTTSGPYTALTETAICEPCHTPHVDPANPPPLLWNHTLSQAGYTLRPGQTIAGSESENCLSCHDGSVAVDAYNGSPGGATGTAGNEISTLVGASGNGDIGTNMFAQHPVAVTYTPGGEFNNIATAEGVGVKIQQNDGNNTVECNSCHDPHDQDTNGSFLRAANNTSQLCTGCHIK